MAIEKEKLTEEYLIDYYVLSHIIIFVSFFFYLEKNKCMYTSLSLFDCSEKTIYFVCHTYHLPMQSNEAFSHEAHNHDPHS